MSKKFTYEFIKNYIEQQGCELITDYYTDNRQKLDILCSQCKTRYSISFSKFKFRNKKFCNSCSLKFKGERRRRTIEQIIHEFKIRGYEIEITEFVKWEEPIKCKNQEGYFGMLSYPNLKWGNHIGRFRTINPFYIDNINLFISKHGFKTKLVSFEHRNETIVDGYFKCECGTEQKWRVDSLLNEGKFRCDICTRKKSSFCIKTEEVLNKQKLKFTTEFVFKNSEISTLRFDYRVEIDDTFLLIEVDGQFHYKPILSGEQDFLAQKNRDIQKNNYCKKHNIHLLRIPYFEFKNKKYINMILEKIKEIQSH